MSRGVRNMLEVLNKIWKILNFFERPPEAIPHLSARDEIWNKCCRHGLITQNNKLNLKFKRFLLYQLCRFESPDLRITESLFMISSISGFLPWPCKNLMITFIMSFPFMPGIDGYFRIPPRLVLPSTVCCPACCYSRTEQNIWRLRSGIWMWADRSAAKSLALSKLVIILCSTSLLKIKYWTLET